jgi:hypothetical protein
MRQEREARRFRLLAWQRSRPGCVLTSASPTEPDWRKDAAMPTRGYAGATRARPRKGNIDARLFALERIYRAATTAAQSLSVEQAAARTWEVIRAVIASRGIEQQPSESLSDAFARALGLSSMALRAELAQFAMAWHPPCHE